MARRKVRTVEKQDLLVQAMKTAFEHVESGALEEEIENARKQKKNRAKKPKKPKKS